MGVAYVSAMAALVGSVVGDLSSSSTTWLSQRVQARAGQIAQETEAREDLYRDFIIAASKAYGDALVNSEPRIPELVSLYVMISRMRVVSLPPTIACADKIMLTTIDTYYLPNRSVRELRDLVGVGVGVGIDPLKEFSEVAREEMRPFRYGKKKRRARSQMNSRAPVYLRDWVSDIQMRGRAHPVWSSKRRVDVD
jgi:hypothetical protein